MQKNSLKKFFLTLLLTETLIFSPTSFAETCSYTNDSDLAAQQTACLTDSSKQWDCKLNRCITPQSVIEARNQIQTCLNLPESTDAEKTAKKACMDNKAKEVTGVQGGFKEQSNSLAKTAYGFSVGMALINSTATKDSNSFCTSKSIFKAAAYGAIAGELYQYFFMKKALEKLQEDYKKGVIKEGAAFEAQVKAFEFLRDEQKAIADMASKKKMLYTALTIAYGAAMAVAILESLPTPLMKPPCTAASTPSNQTQPTNSGPEAAPPAEEINSPSADQASTSQGNLHRTNFDYRNFSAHKIIAQTQILKADTALNSFFIFQEQLDFLDGQVSISPSVDAYHQVAQANVIDEKQSLTFKEILANAFNYAFPQAQAAGAVSEFLPILLGAAGGAAAIKYGSGDLLSKLNSSPGIAVVSGVCSFMSMSLSSEASRVKDQASSNVKKIEEIIAKFKSDMAQFCPKSGDRDDMNKPECFCYTSNNEKNTTRVNSQTCQNYWAWKEHNYAKAASNYDALKIPNQGCIDLAGKLDSTCACRKVTNTKTGTNGCLKSNLSSYNLGSLGTMSGLTQAAQIIDSANQGDLAGANVESSVLGKNAANTQKMLDSLLSQAASKNVNIPSPKDSQFREKFLAALTPNSLLEASRAGAIGANNNPTSLRPDIPAINEAVKKSGLPAGEDYQGGANKGKKASSDNFTIPNISGDSSNSNTQDKVVEGFMDKEREFKVNDIVKDEGVPIWTILSNRYMTSGYRRLFEDNSQPQVKPTAAGAVKQ